MNDSTWRAFQPVVLLATLLAGTIVFLHGVGPYAPISTWLSWRYALSWSLVVVFAAACVAAGHLVIRVLLGRPALHEDAPSDFALPASLGLRDHLVLSFAAGVLVFSTLTFLAGIAGVLGGVFFVAAPVALLISGGPVALRELGPRVRQALLDWRNEPRPALWVTAVTAFGVLGVVLVYLPILAPENVSYDSRWYHLALAEQYAVDGAIRRFPEGLLAGTYPALATQVYTWAFLCPGAKLFEHVEIAAHLEFIVFLATLAGIPSLVRRLVPGVSARWSWATLFLFPGIFVYDSSLVCGADHFAALFAVPIFISLFAAWDRLEPRVCALLAVFVSAAVGTKYTAVSLAILPILALMVRAVWLRRVRGATVFAATSLVITTQHWLRNWLFYGDPVYPMLAEHFAPRPWTVDSAAWLRTFHELKWIPGVFVAESPLDLVRILATFSLDTHDFPHFHGKVPVFGSLFTVATALLFFLRSTRRIWAVTLATYVGVTYWALLTPQDRYLQALLPWMVAVTAAVLVRVWGVGGAARGGVCVVVIAQLLATGDAYFLPSHAMTRHAPLRAVMDLVERRYRADGDHSDGTATLAPYDGWPAVGELLPSDARVLLHEQTVHLGLGRAAVLDYIPYSYGIDYGHLASMRAVWDRLRSMGVTHVLWEPRSAAGDSFAGDLVFFSFAQRYGQRQERPHYGDEQELVTPWSLAALPTEPPPDAPHGSVVISGCASVPYAPGVYELRDLNVPVQLHSGPSSYPSPRQRWQTMSSSERSAALARAEFVIAQTSAPPGCEPLTRNDIAPFRFLAQRGSYELYARPIVAP